MMGSRKFYVKDGECFTTDEKRELVGRVEDVALDCEIEAQGFTRKQLEESAKGREYLEMLKEQIGG